MLDNAARGSEVRTDGWQGYFDIGRYRFVHVVTNVSATGDPGGGKSGSRVEAPLPATEQQPRSAR